jgi:hypothetical protein
LSDLSSIVDVADHLLHGVPLVTTVLGRTIIQMLLKVD